MNNDVDCYYFDFCKTNKDHCSKCSRNSDNQDIEDFYQYNGNMPLKWQALESQATSPVSH